MNRSDDIGELAKALAKAQEKFPKIIKNSRAEIPTKSGGKFSYTYLSLDALIEFLRENLQGTGLSFMQFHESERIGVIVETIVLHESGQYMSGKIFVPVRDPNDAQAFGSASTYGRRYGLEAAFGMSGEDDDGSGASGGKAPTPTNRQKVGQQEVKAAANRVEAAANRQQQARQEAPAATDADKAYQEKVEQHFGVKTAAAKRSGEIMELCRKLNEVGHETKWTFDNLETHVQDNFDKAIKQLDDDELNVLITDLKDTLDERLAIRNEPADSKAPIRSASTPKGKILPKDDEPATPDQCHALRQLCTINETVEPDVLQSKFGDQFLDGTKSTFELLTFGEAKGMIAYIGSMKKK